MIHCPQNVSKMGSAKKMNTHKKANKSIYILTYVIYGILTKLDRIMVGWCSMFSQGMMFNA